MDLQKTKDTTHRHHCIPKFYLKQFAVEFKEDKYQINCYNKNNGKKFHNIIDNIGFVKDYNTIILDEKESDEFEHFHNDIFEKKFSRLFYRLIEKIDKFFQDYKILNCLSMQYRKDFFVDSIISDAQKYFLSILLSYFILRTKKIRYSFEELVRQTKLIYEDFSKVNSLNADEAELAFYRDFGDQNLRKNSYIKLPFDSKLLLSIHEILYSHKWCIAYNDTEELIYASDNVYGLTCMVDYPKARGLGFNTYGNVIIFPLTPRICILMIDSRYFNNINNRCGDFFTELLSVDDIKNINKIMVLSGTDEIYSRDGNWNHLDETIKVYNLPLGHKPYNIS